MALRFGIGKVRLKGFSLPKFGIRGSLFAAFAVIAGMAIAISAGAGLMLGHLGGAITELSGRDIPRLAASLQLSAESASLASQGPGLLASRSEEMLNERTKKMTESRQITLQKLGEITKFGANKDTVSALTETVKNIEDMIQSLGSAARERLETGAQHDKLYAALRNAQAGFVKAAAPAMVDAQSQLNGVFGAPNFSQDEATQAEKTVEQISDIIAAGNLTAFNMMAALSSESSDTLETIEKQTRAALQRLKSNLDQLRKGSLTTALTNAT